MDRTYKIKVLKILEEIEYITSNFYNPNDIHLGIEVFKNVCRLEIADASVFELIANSFSLLTIQKGIEIRPGTNVIWIDLEEV